MHQLLFSLFIVASIISLVRFGAISLLRFCIHIQKMCCVRGLSDDQLAALANANITYRKINDQIPGLVLFRAVHLDRVMGVLGAEAVYSFPGVVTNELAHIMPPLTASNFKEVILKHRPAQDAELEAHTVSFAQALAQNELETAIIEAVRAHLLPTIRQNIVVHTERSVECGPIEDESFHIFAGSLPAALLGQGIQAPPTVFCVPFHGEDTTEQLAFPPSRQGIPIVDTNTDFTVAELFASHLCINVDLSPFAHEEQVALWICILAQVAEEHKNEQILSRALQCLPDDITVYDTTGLRVEFEQPLQRFARHTSAVIRKALLPSVRRNILVHTNAGVRPPISDDRFHIFICSAADSTELVAIPSTIFGMAMPVRENEVTFSPTGQGIPVIDWSNGFAVAELVDNCLYIHINVLSDILSLQERLTALAVILQKAQEELSVEQIVSQALGSLPLGSRIDEGDPARLEVFTEGYASRLESIIGGLVQTIIIPVVGRAVFVRHCHGTNQAPLLDGMFHIFFQSAPFGESRWDTASELWGYPLIKENHGFWLSGAGIPIADNSGRIIAELMYDNLYIFQKILHHGTRMEATVLARLLYAVREALGDLVGLADDRVKTDLFAKYQNECWETANTSSSFDRTQFAQAQEEFRMLLRATMQDEQHLMRLEASPDEELGREFDQLLSIEKVKNVHVSDDAIIVDTDILFCVDPRTNCNHEIGAFEIRIPTEHSSQIIWKNKTRLVEGYQKVKMNAPHVNRAGYACLGNMKDLFPLLIQKREFATVVELAIAFIESVNVKDSWGSYIDNWPIAHGQTKPPDEGDIS